MKSWTTVKSIHPTRTYYGKVNKVVLFFHINFVSYFCLYPRLLCHVQRILIYFTKIEILSPDLPLIKFHGFFSENYVKEVLEIAKTAPLEPLVSSFILFIFHSVSLRLIL